MSGIIVVHVVLPTQSSVEIDTLVDERPNPTCTNCSCSSVAKSATKEKTDIAWAGPRNRLVGVGTVSVVGVVVVELKGRPGEVRRAAGRYGGGRYQAGVFARQSCGWFPRESSVAHL